MRRILPAALLGALAACQPPNCVNTVVGRETSPDGKLDAVMFVRNCEEVDEDFDTQISLVPAGETPLGIGNIYIADTNMGKAATAEWLGPWTTTEWRDENLLLIRYAKHTRIFTLIEYTQGIQIIYEERVDLPQSRPRTS
jgi:hypothetical protein